MNIVKGVADLIWRSSSAGQSREYASTSQSGRFALPTQNIIFSEEGDEAILKTLWEKFVNAGNEVEKRKSQLVFLKQFLTTYRNWKPLNFGLGLRTEEDALVPPAEYDVTDVIVGCKFSHPADIICVLTEDIPQIARLLSLTDTQVGSPAAITVTSESLMGLDALTVATRSIHNCKVFGYYGGIQKLTALMKVSIVQLKTILSALSTGEMVSNGMVQNARILQMILGLVVSVICNFVHLHSIMEENGVNKSSNIPSATSDEVLTNSSTDLNSLLPEKILSWHQIAVMSVMEAGGLNWLLEILRLLRRLTMKGQWVDMSLQHLTLKALRSSLTCNLRGQNHFRSIGGLEVLLDGLGISYFDSLTMNDSSDNTDMSKNALLSMFDLHILSLEVLREAVQSYISCREHGLAGESKILCFNAFTSNGYLFHLTGCSFGNFNNLQFLCENGRVQKFANSFCSVAFMLQEYKQLRDLFEEDNMNGAEPNTSVTSRTDVCSSSPCDLSYLQHWKNYVVRLGAVFCNFLLEGNGTECCCTQLNARIYTITVSVNYTELSAKWFSRVLCTVFPCIKACSDQNEMPKHLRVFAHTMQHKAIYAFKKVLSSSPALIDVLRGEGVWDFLFSESFYYFGPTLTETSGHNYCRNEISLMGDQENGDSSYSKRQNLSDVQLIQVDVISFVEFAATLSGISHNLPECTVLVDALEQSASNPVLAGILAKTLLQILLLGVEKTVSSFKTVAAIPRILKVACIQVQESKMPNGLSFSRTTKSDVASSQLNVATDSPESWDECMESFMQLFEKFFSVSDDAKISILHNSMAITCMFDLFWQESLRNLMLKSFIELLMIVPASEEDQKALVFLCSKYVETFTHLKERAQNFSDLSIALLTGMRELLQIDKVRYQALFCESECFLHVVSLLNGNHLDAENGEKLALEVIQTLTYLLSQSDSSKGAFRALVGKGYPMMQSLLLDFCQWQPTEALLNALLDMLVDGNFDLQTNVVIKNEDAILLYLNVLQKSSNVMQHRGLSTFLYLLKDSLSNRAKCVRAGMLDLVLNWFSQSSDEDLVEKLSQLIQVIGGHSISGKDIRKIFALLRSEAAGSPRQLSLLLSSMLSMLSEKGPIAFFDLNGVDSGIEIKTPFQMPLNKGFSFTCWLRVEKFPPNGVMSLFSFLTDNGRGCRALLAKDKLVYESINLKRQHVSLNVNLVENKWHFFSLVHSIGRPFSGGSQLKCYVDGILTSSVKCRYAKINEQVTNCTVGAKVTLPINEEDDSTYSANDSRPFLGQIGPLYLFGDAITSELVQGIWSLGPSYMYCFLDNEMSTNVDNSFSGVVLDAKESLASKIIFGLSAQASNGRTLFNVSSHLDYALDKNPFEATLLVGSQLCSRRMLQQIIYCVGGVSVFFPLLLQSDVYESDPADELKETAVTPVGKKYYSAEIIKLIVSNLDDNVANQQQMLLLFGIPILGFLLQSVPKNQLNLETLSALKHLFRVITCSELLVADAISHIFLNPRIWVQPVYEVQRELYLFIIQQFDANPRLLKSLCRLSRVLDIICQFHCNSVDCVLKDLTEEKRDREEVHKIRLLLLSLGEMSLREYIAASDVEALIAFFETCQDVACIEDTLNMILRAVSQEQVLSSFVEQVNVFGGCHIFLNLLLRDFEPIRLLSLQFIGRLLLGSPSGKKGSKFFNISVGKSKSSSGQKKINLHGQPIFSVLSDRLFQFPETDLLCATIFDVLLGGASPKQVLRKHNQFDQLKNSKNNSQFLLPQFLSLIFRFLSGCSDRISRMKIMGDLLELLDSNPSNIEAFMESGWNAWLDSSANFDVIKNHGKNVNISDICEMEMDERHLVRNLYSLVLCHYLISVKGGWQYLEETVNFLLIQSEQDAMSFPSFVRDLYGDLLHKLLNITSDENIFILQPCRDNIFYLVKLLDEMLISEMNYQLLFPEESSTHPPHCTDFDGLPNFNSLFDALEGDPAKRSGISGGQDQNDINIDRTNLDEWWNIYDSVWTVIGELTGKGPSRTLPRSSSFTVPSLSQRARGLVESLNIPAAEMAAAVSGGIGNALTGKPNRTVDKAMVLRGERCSRFVYRMVILFLCKSSLERASRCVQQFISILPFLLSADDEQSKSRLHLFIWALLSVRSRYGPLDGDARYHVISRLLHETIICGKSMLAATINDDDLSDISSNSKEGRIVFNFIQKDRVLGAGVDEVKYVKNVKNDRALQLVELRSRLEENKVTGSIKKLELEDQIQGILTTIRASDDRRRFLFQQSLDEDQQIIADKWIHTFRLLIDERGPWSANPFPNGVVAHWKLDKSEDAWRRRQKLRQNYHFDDNLCQPSVLSRDGALPSNSDGKISVGALNVEKMKQFSLKGIKRIMDDSDPSENYNEADSSHQRVSEIEGSSERQHFETSKDNRETVLREDYPSTSESENREVLMAMPCVLVTPKRKIAGRLAITRTLLHFFGDFLVEGTAGSAVLESLYSSGNLDPRIPELSGEPLRNNLQKLPSHLDLDTKRPRLGENLYFNKEYGNGKSHKSVKRHRWWNTCKINAVHWTRYLLRYTAVEIFLVNSAAPIFLNFASQKVAKDVGNLIVVTRNETMFARGHRDKTGFISFVDRRLAQEMAESARERWKRREITNFEYLMILNTLSGRSYNDLTQYPVFPWILADYSSETLDLNKSSTYRDLSKPVGALDAKRFEVFEDRYHNFVDPDIPSFYYGSHYSSMGIVLFYLLRLEPFTALHRSLQGGKFDHADRLFQSIEGTYRNCLSNTSDVKELIPEFFYMPEFLMNSNSYHFGVKQDGEPIGDVCLPPWAKGSPEEFISRNREALESEYVSSNLHHWIDLVFGYKQRGKPAAEAANIFYYLTYEGAVNLDNMEDDLQRSAIEDQIANFGQTPIQLFKKKHPRRGPPIPIAHLLQFAPNSINLTSVVAKTSNSDSAVMYINVVDSYIVAVNENFTMSVKMWLTTQLQSGGNLTFSSSQELFFGIGSDVLPPCKIGSPLADGFELGSECFETLQTPSDNFLISCGSWENSFQVTSLSNGKIVQSVRHHKDVVSCVAVTADGSILATGSYDTTVMIWEIFRIRGPEKRSRSTRPESSWKDHVISDTPSHILCGHDDIITCLYASAELDLVISGSKDGTCIIHSLQTGRYVRSIQHPGDRPLSKLVVSRHGRIVLYSDDLRLHLFSINGRHLATAESSGRLGCLELSRCGEFLICAGEQGHIVVRSMNSLEMITKYSGIGKSITSLTVTPEECFIAGTKDGSLLVYSIENKTGSQRSSKSKTNRT